LTPTHCHKLQYTATYCSTLQHTAAHCITLHHTATHCNTQCSTNIPLSHIFCPHNYRMLGTVNVKSCSPIPSWSFTFSTASHCNTLQHTASQCSTLHHTATQSATHASHVFCSHNQRALDTVNVTFCPQYPDSFSRLRLRHTAAHCNTLRHTVQHTHPISFVRTTTRCWALWM